MTRTRSAVSRLKNGGGTGPASIVLLHCSLINPACAAAKHHCRKSLRPDYFASRSVGMPVPKARAMPIRPKTNVTAATDVFREGQRALRAGRLGASCGPNDGEGCEGLCACETGVDTPVAGDGGVAELGDAGEASWGAGPL